MKPIGALCLIVGLVLLIGSCASGFYMRWMEHPELTDRMLFLEHTWRVILQGLATFIGLALTFIEFSVLTDEI